MKKHYLVTLYFISLVSINLLGQNPIVKVHSNGLIYSEETMGHLEYLVDSLSLQFKSCASNKQFYSVIQGRGTYFKIQNPSHIESFKQLVSKNTPFELIVETLPKMEVISNLLLLAVIDTIDYCPIIIEVSMDLNDYKNKKNCNYSINQILHKQRLYIYINNGYYLEGYYLPVGLSKLKLKNKYAEIIHYADCVIDTSTSTFIDIPKSNEDLDNHYAKELFNLIDQFPDRPIYQQGDFNEISYAEYTKKLEFWKKQKSKWVDIELSKTSKFIELLDQASNIALHGSNYGSRLEYYVEKYRSKEFALKLKRARKVFGGCSGNIAPFIHLQEIAKLAAQTLKLSIFIRAHLDIMNNRFMYRGNNNYVLFERKIFIKELERLNLNIPKLLIGTGIIASNLNKNHYISYSEHLGQAISESENKYQFEAYLLEMIKDNSLDDYNRLLMFHIYKSYILKLSSLTINEKYEYINRIIINLPLYISKQIDSK